MTAFVVLPAAVVPSSVLWIGLVACLIVAGAVVLVDRRVVGALAVALVATGALIAQSPKPDSPIYCSCPVLQCLTIGCWPSAHSTTVETPWIRR